jgi:hypothetical protein
MELLCEDIQDRYKSRLNYKLQCRGIRIVAEVDYPRGSCEHFIILNSFMPLCLYIQNVSSTCHIILMISHIVTNMEAHYMRLDGFRFRNVSK